MPRMNTLELREVPGLVDIFVSRGGIVLDAEGEQRSPTPDSGGYPTIRQKLDGKIKAVRLHRAVLLVWGGPPPEGKPLCLHWDDNKLNNRLGNLRWGSDQDNMDDSIRNGREFKRGTVTMSDEEVLEVVRLLDDGVSVKDTAARVGTSVRSVTDIAHGQVRASLTGIHRTRGVASAARGRERRIAALHLGGARNDEIAIELGIRPNGVSNVLSRLRSRGELPAKK